MESLLNTSFELFTSQGINQTSISDIVKKAGVAKGTFYLYFKDKYDIRNRLIARKSNQLFIDAYHDLEKEDITGVEDKVIFIMKNVLMRLKEEPKLLSLIYKDLSWALFKEAVTDFSEEEDENMILIITDMLENSPVKYREHEGVLAAKAVISETEKVPADIFSGIGLIVDDEIAEISENGIY